MRKSNIAYQYNLKKTLPKLAKVRSLGDLKKWVGWRKRMLIAGSKDFWNKFYKNYFHGTIIAVIFLSSVFGVAMFQTARGASRQLRETTTQKQQLESELSTKAQELQKAVESTTTTQQEKDTLKAQYEALEKKYKALEQAKAARGRVYAAAPSTPSGDWVAQCHAWAAEAGISLPPAAIELIDRESDCNPCVVNGGTINCGYNGERAFGIPQALPSWKTGCRSEPICQLKWMQNYVMGRYGGWENALAHSHANGWY